MSAPRSRTRIERGPRHVVDAVGFVWICEAVARHGGDAQFLILLPPRYIGGAKDIDRVAVLARAARTLSIFSMRLSTRWCRIALTERQT